MKSQQAVRNIRVALDNESGNSGNFCRIDIAGYQQGIGNQQRRGRPAVDFFGCVGKVIEGASIGNTGKSNMQ